MSVIRHPAAHPSAPALMAILDRFNRDEIGNAIEVLVALLDIRDGDPDLEPNGDELDGSLAEDDFCPPRKRFEPGIPV